MHNKRILFIEPPVDYVNPEVNLGCNLGICSIISFVKKYCEIEVDFYSFEYAKVLQGENPTIDQVLDNYNPDIVCVSILTHAVNFAEHFSRSAKKRGCIVIWGGIYVSYNAQTLMPKEDYVDYMIVGEGENVLPYIIKSTDNGLCDLKKSIIYCNDKCIKKLPYCVPDFSIIPEAMIREHSLRATFEMTKGCSYKCGFCCVKGIRSPNSEKKEEYIEKELINIANAGFKKTIICDNNFVPGNKKFEEFICIKEKLIPSMKFRVTVRADLISNELLEKYKRLGVDELIMGIEHVNPDILLSMKKTDVPEKWRNIAKKAVTLAAAMGFLVHPIFMIGWPGETSETLKQNRDVACELGKEKNVEPFVSFFTPHPGSESERFVFDGQVKYITSDLSKYIHLYPVSVPISYSGRAIEDFVDVHNEIRIVSEMTYRNPCIDINYVYQYADLL